MSLALEHMKWKKGIELKLSMVELQPTCAGHVSVASCITSTRTAHLVNPGYASSKELRMNTFSNVLGCSSVIELVSCSELLDQIIEKSFSSGQPT